MQLVDEAGTPQLGVLGEYSLDTLFDDLGPGAYTARVTDARFEQVETEAKLGELLDITLLGAASLKVEVVDRATGEPLSHYALEVVYTDASVRPNRHQLLGAGDAKPGDGVVSGIVPGRVEIVVKVAGRPDTSVSLDRLEAGDPTPVRLEIPLGHELHGHASSMRTPR